MMNNSFKAGTQSAQPTYGYPYQAYSTYHGAMQQPLPGISPGTMKQPMAGIQQGPVMVPTMPGGAMTPHMGGATLPPGAPGYNAQLAAHGQLPIERSYIENILRLNLGKIATLYMTYENNNEWNAKIFKGRLEAAGRDHVVISDPNTGMRFLLLMVNLDYATFDEELNYSAAFGGVPATR